MPFLSEVYFFGQGGIRHTFHVYSKVDVLIPAAAVYMFLKIKYIYGNGELILDFEPLYIGLTTNLSERIKNHEKLDCVNKYGCTHIGVMFIDSELAGLDVVSNLRHVFPTVCNS